MVRTLGRSNPRSNQMKFNLGAIAAAAVALVSSSHGALADAADACRQGGPETLGVCSEVIGDPKFKFDDRLMAYKQRGEARLNAGYNRLAILDFSESIRLNKDDVSAFVGRGRAKLADGALAGSIADFSSAIRILPKSDPGYAMRSSSLYTERAHVRIVSKQLDAAVGDLNEAIRLNPLDGQAWNTRGVAYVKKHDYARAVDDYTAAIALIPYPVMYENRGYAYELQGRQKEAVDDLQLALNRDPSLIGARDGLERLGAPIDAAAKTNQRLRQGAVLAEKSCSGCHAVGPTGESPQKNATEFRNYYKKHPLFALKSPVDKAIREIHYEAKDQNPSAAKILISDDEIDTVVAYINSLSTSARLNHSETTGSGSQ